MDSDANNHDAELSFSHSSLNLITIRIKTLDNSIHDMRVPVSMVVRDLKAKIQQVRPTSCMHIYCIKELDVPVVR